MQPTLKSGGVGTVNKKEEDKDGSRISPSNLYNNFGNNNNNENGLMNSSSSSFNPISLKSRNFSQQHASSSTSTNSPTTTSSLQHNSPTTQGYKRSSSKMMKNKSSLKHVILYCFCFLISLGMFSYIIYLLFNKRESLVEKMVLWYERNYVTSDPSLNYYFHASLVHNDNKANEEQNKLKAKTNKKKTSLLYYAKHYNKHRRYRIRQAFLHAWNGYETYAFGHDELRPVSNKTNDSWGGFGVYIYEALDTMLLMKLKKPYEKVMNFLSERKNNNNKKKNTTIGFKKNVRVSFFETTIRLLGGLLGGYTLSNSKNNEILKQQALELGNYLLPAFNNRPSGFPCHSINLKDGKCSDAEWASLSIKKPCILSEIGSIQLEFQYLSHITVQLQQLRRVIIRKTISRKRISRKRLKKNNKEKTNKKDVSKDSTKDNSKDNNDLQGDLQGLFPTVYDVTTGKPDDSSLITFGGLADSFYEYLLKQYLLLKTTPEKEKQFLKEMYLSSIEKMKKYLIHKVDDNTILLKEMKEGKLINQFEHLTCFLPGTITLGYRNGINSEEDFKIAKQLLNGCIKLYEDHLAPDKITFEEIKTDNRFEYFFNYNNNQKNKLDSNNRFIWNMTEVTISDPSYLLRPETLESLFYIKTKTQSAYSGLSNVMDGKKNDSMQSFFFAETLKYLYLMFMEDGQQEEILNNYILTTEAHFVKPF
ncbi:hypothetical protein ABK040_009193 [Willaertia magna]